MARKLICQWRLTKAEPWGLMVWFDPSTEVVRLYELEPSTESGVYEVDEGDDPESNSDLNPPSKQQFLQEELPW